MSDTSDFLSKQKISAALNPGDGYECFVDGSSIGLGANPLPCILNSVAGQVAKVIIADGEDTGVEMSVPLSSVTTVGSAKMAQVARNLFRGEKL
jgi:hypothetical protein